MLDIHCKGRLIEKICRYYVADNKFVFAEITCNFSKEIALIIGLPFHEKTINLKSKKTSDFWLLNKHFPESKALHRKDLMSMLIELFQSKEEEDIQDFVWFYEHTRMRKSSAYGRFPRMLRWVDPKKMFTGMRSNSSSPICKVDCRPSEHENHAEEKNGRGDNSE
ncbi:hypothetical protein QJS10_CPA06g00878 [Acorus calamus]|uniref:Uncharacterized protein n=1 Tax=Acorus calamus TaxID=4465 RepID=A0AAV9EK24_ACOCL|nr:hypothetical protein QJS10_CPA06g00878 [Acorus calamus]